MRRSFGILSLLAVSSLPCRAAVSGTVTDRAGNDLAGVGVTLAMAGSSTTTDATGAWSLATTEIGVKDGSTSKIRWTGKVVELTLREPSMVSVEAYDFKGARQRRSASVRLGAGLHNLPLPLSGSGMVWLRVIVNGRTETVLAAGTVVGIGPIVGIGHARSLQRQQQTTAARSQGIVDTLRFTWQSKVVARIPLVNPDTTGIVVRFEPANDGWNPSIAYGNLYDARDGQVYRTVKIGPQTWMAENLNVKPIGADSGWFYDNLVSNGLIYGRLYTWNAVMDGVASSTSSPSGVQGICPMGWHVPSDPEWTKLIDTTLAPSATAGTRLKAKVIWTSPIGKDDSGFRVLPAGYREGTGTFYSGGSSADFWSASKYSETFAFRRNFFPGGTNVNSYVGEMATGYSVRCLLD